jgi:ethylene receptor
MEPCRCAGSIWDSGNNLAKYQFVSDLFISLAYFSIPLELVYLSRNISLAAYRRILLQFGAFIVLCGATHFINLLGFSGYTETVDTIQAVTKVLCALVSCATAISLIGMIQEFLAYKLELYLKNKAAEIDAERGLLKNLESTGKTDQY